MKHTLKTFILLFLCTALPMHAYGDEVKPSENPDISKAKDFVTNLSDSIFSIVNSQEITDIEKEKQLIRIFKQSVDTDWMGVFVLGRYYRTAEPAQSKRYLKLYHEYLINSYIPKFRQYAGETFEVLRIREKSKNDFIIQTKLNNNIEANNEDIRVDYRLRKNGTGSFKVVDIIGEGISLITTQRSDFGGLISRKGVGYFIDKLEAKVNEMKKTKQQAS